MGWPSPSIFSLVPPSVSLHNLPALPYERTRSQWSCRGKRGISRWRFQWCRSRIRHVLFLFRWMSARRRFCLQRPSFCHGELDSSNMIHTNRITSKTSFPSPLRGYKMDICFKTSAWTSWWRNWAQSRRGAAAAGSSGAPLLRWWQKLEICVDRHLGERHGAADVGEWDERQGRHGGNPVDSELVQVDCAEADADDSKDVHLFGI